MVRLLSVFALYFPIAGAREQSFRWRKVQGQERKRKAQDEGFDPRAETSATPKPRRKRRASV
jgi:hypothetical protein